MMVTWSTFNDTNESTVEFGITPMNNLSMTAKGNRTKFVDGGSEKHTQFIHRVKLTGLKTGNMYCKLFNLNISIVSVIIIFLTLFNGYTFPVKSHIRIRHYTKIVGYLRITLCVIYLILIHYYERNGIIMREME